MKALIFALTIAIAAPAIVSAAESTSESMAFESCLELIRRTSTQIGVSPTNIVETNDLRMVRWETNGGSCQSVLVTCSRQDQKMVMTISQE